MQDYSEISTNLEQLFELDPALPENLENALDVDQAVTLITASAGRHEVLMDAERLEEYLEAQMLAPTDISDESLAGISGGMSRGGRKLANLKRKMRRMAG